MTAPTVARLRIRLDGVKPAVERRLEVPIKIRLDRLHLVFQAAMGWTNSHLYEIRARDSGWGWVDPDGDDEPLDASKSRLIDLMEETGAKTFRYLYDFGDGWEHTVKVERVVDAVPGLSYPFLISGTGACPPEDCGGPFGYAEFLDAINDPAHERHAELTEWNDGAFDPTQVDLAGHAGHARALDELARKWTRKPRIPRK